MTLFPYRRLLAMGVDVGFRNMASVMVDVTKGLSNILGTKLLTTKNDKSKSHLLVADRDSIPTQYLAANLKAHYYEFKDDNTSIILCAEMPSGGAKNARAGWLMGLASGIVSTFVAFERVPFVNVAPGDVKFVATGKRTGEKKKVKNYVVKSFQPQIAFFGFVGKKTTYRVVDVMYSDKEFEHIADAFAAVAWARVHSPVYKAFIG